MILFPNAKINIGLKVLRRRADGYHDISTVMVPVGWCDILEMVPASGHGSFTMIDGEELGLTNIEDNLVVKALKALEKHIGKVLPSVDIYLKKVIPSGAGLGGGSADAAFAIRGANELFSLGLTDSEMAIIAASVGADCPFFIYNRPMHAEGIGEILTPIEMPVLDQLWVTIAKPAAEAVATKTAYAGVIPQELQSGESLKRSLEASPEFWPDDKLVSNDFEKSIFPLRPQIAEVKKKMQNSGALYSAMSGSGAAVFGIFANDKMAEKAARLFCDCDIFVGKLSSTRLS